MNARERFLSAWRRSPRRMLVFSHGISDVPTLGTMSDVARSVRAEIHHAGFGVFLARRLAEAEPVFTFDAGGMMSRDDDDHYSWSELRLDRGHTARDKRAIHAIYRDIAAKGNP